MPGSAVFELQLAEALRKLPRKGNLIRMEVRDAVADIFELIGNELLLNEGVSVGELQTDFRETEKIAGFLDEYKAKKFSINSAFFYLTLALKGLFPEKKTLEFSS